MSEVRGSADPPDPRVRRTHERVVTVARQVLLEGGSRALNYSRLEKRAGVTRQTLYRHWPRLELLMAEVVTTGPVEPDLRPGSDARVVLLEFLGAMRDRFTDRTTFAAWVAVIGASGADDTAAAALSSVSEARQALLNHLLEPADLTVDRAGFARLIGPVLFGILHARDAVDNDFLAGTVDAWLRGRGGTGPPNRGDQQRRPAPQPPGP